MYSLFIDQIEIYYAQYTGKTPKLDANGHRTLEYEKHYSEPQSLWISVSPAKGAAYTSPLGINLDYSKTLSTDDMTCPLTEESVLWIDKAPYETVDGVTKQTPHNYIVTTVAKGLNTIVYGVKEVKVS